MKTKTHTKQKGQRLLPGAPGSAMEILVLIPSGIGALGFTHANTKAEKKLFKEAWKRHTQKKNWRELDFILSRPLPNTDLRHGVGNRASQPKEMTDEK
jgi:hypothetical protein